MISTEKLIGTDYWRLKGSGIPLMIDGGLVFEEEVSFPIRGARIAAFEVPIIPNPLIFLDPSSSHTVYYYECVNKKDFVDDEFLSLLGYKTASVMTKIDQNTVNSVFTEQPTKMFGYDEIH